MLIILNLSLDFVPISTQQAATHHSLKEEWEERGREVKQISLCPSSVRSSGEQLGKKDMARAKMQLREFSMDSKCPHCLCHLLAKNTPVLLSKITQGIQGISAELPYQ